MTETVRNHTPEPRASRSALVQILRLLLPVLLLCFASFADAAEAAKPPGEPFPLPLEQYGAPSANGIIETLKHRAQVEPFNVVATVIFVLAIIHTFLASKFMHIAHHWRDEHRARVAASGYERRPGQPEPVSFRAEMMHFLGEVEVVFGIWTIPLFAAITYWKGWGTAEYYVSKTVVFTEPLFVVIIMCIASTRPILRFAEQSLRLLANLGGGSRAAWWLTILTVGPLLGSFITEPAAMTICALLLARQFYDLKPSLKFRYATLGLLFVNISVGGTLTHFAAPPVLMVAAKWDWGMGHMFWNFGWKAALGIVISNLIYFAIFRREFASLKVAPAYAAEHPHNWSDRTDAVPAWVTVVHIAALGWTVFTAHDPAFFIGGFLFLLAFTAATEHHQNPMSLKPAILVGFFLAALVIHGGLQGWWIAPVLASLSEVPLLLGAMTLTAVNDNAAITYLATLVPDFSAAMKYAVVAGAVIGGGLTVIANAPNPAGQSILADYFEDGVSPGGLFLGALIPTIVMAVIFLIFR